MLIFFKNVIRTPFGVGGTNKTPEIVLQDPHPPAPPYVSGILGFWGLSVGTFEFSPEAFWSTNISIWVDIWAKCGVDHFWSTALGQSNPPSGRAWLTTYSEILTSQNWKKSQNFGDAKTYDPVPRQDFWTRVYTHIYTYMHICIYMTIVIIPDGVGG